MSERFAGSHALRRLPAGDRTPSGRLPAGLRRLGAALSFALCLALGAGGIAPVLAADRTASGLLPSDRTASGLLPSGESVPAVVAGPELAASAEVVDAPINAVTVFSDRARVRRVGHAPAHRGAYAVRLPDLPGGALLDTLRLDVTGGQVLRVEARPVERDERAISKAWGLVAEVENLNPELLTRPPLVGLQSGSPAVFGVAMC